MLMAPPDPRKRVLEEEKYNSTNFQTLWDFEGVFKYSPLFYGWYTHLESNKGGYRRPLAYFMTGLVLYAYSFFAILRKMAENSRMSKLSEKDDECIFSWKLFTAWDYMIGNPETAHNRIASIVVGFKEALLEEAEKKREARNWKVTGIRILVNTVVLGLLVFSAYAVVMVVKRSTEPEARSSVWRSNEITFVMTIISITFPMLFEGLGFLEQYHPRKQLRLQLARIMVLNLLNLYSLIFALFDKINDMTSELNTFKNASVLANNTLLQPYPTLTKCYHTCSLESESDTLQSASLLTAVVANVSRVVYPLIHKDSEKSNVDSTTSTNEPSENTTLWNNNTYFVSYSSTNFTLNATAENATSELEDFQNSLLDYLTFVLSNASLNEKNVSSDTEHDPTSFINGHIATTVPPAVNVTDPQKFTPNLEAMSSLSSVKVNTTRRMVCEEICENVTEAPPPLFSEVGYNYTTKRRLRNLCWETMFGQELIKLTVMDLIMTVLSTLAMDFIRGIFVRFMNTCWCWDLEKVFPQYGDFKVAENILHLVNNQGMVWMGMFFSPGLIPINVVKLFVMVYFRAWIVLTCNTPPEIIFRASRSNNFYYALLLMMLFLCVLPVGYAIVWITPSWNCGPFSNYQRIFHSFTKTLKSIVPDPIEKALDYIASPGIVIPLLLLLVLIIYYLISLTNALREANSDLKIQLRRERTEERRKMFQIADRRRRVGSGGSGEFANTPFAKWKKLLGTMPTGGKSFDDTSPRQESKDFPQVKEEKPEPTKSKDFFAKFIRKALGKSSPSEVEQENQNMDEGTDTEQHESLPEDWDSTKDPRPHASLKVSISSGSFDLQRSASFLKKKHSNSDSSHTKETRVTRPTREVRQDSASSAWSDNVPVRSGKVTRPKREVRQDSASSAWSDNIPIRSAHVAKRKKEVRQDSASSAWSDNIPVRSSQATKPKKEVRQDSSSSVWSDNIPVITISKTESTECLDVVPEVPKVTTVAGAPPDNRFKPKIKCVLKKQSTEIDEDLICYFSKGPEPSHELLDDHLDPSAVSESSDDTARESSTDTVLRSPGITLAKPEEFDDEKESEATLEISSANETPTESSAEYNDIASL